MNKKLKIYSTLFVAVLIILVVTNVFYFHESMWYATPNDKLEFVDCPPEFMTRETLPDGSVITTNHETYGYEVYVAPKDKFKQKSLISTAKMSDSDGVELQTYMVEMQKVKLSVPASQKRFFNVLFVVSVITSVVALINPFSCASAHNSAIPSSMMVGFPSLISLTLFSFTSTPTTRCPNFARHAAPTHPTYPNPKIDIFIFFLFIH